MVLTHSPPVNRERSPSVITLVKFKLESDSPANAAGAARDQRVFSVQRHINLLVFTV